MKPLKSSKALKNPRGRSPGRKMPLSRKSGPSRSPPRSTVSGRSGGHLSGMKRPPPPPPPPPASSSSSSRPSKRSRSPRSHSYGSPQRTSSHKTQSAASVDRARSTKKGSNGDKKSHYSHSPHEHRVEAASRRRLTPPSHVTRPPEFDSPLKKKARREDIHYSDRAPPLTHSPVHRSSEKGHARMPPEGHMPRKGGSVAAGSYAHGRDKEYMPSSSKGRIMYESEPSRDGYGSLTSGAPSSLRQKSGGGAELEYHHRDQYPDHKRGRDHADTYTSDRNKQYGLTLDERFRTVSSDSARAHAEQRTYYNREELENITIDIKRNMRQYSPTVRHIIDPSEVKLVRRPGEGTRPLFDREEIKQSSRDMREDAHFEQKVYSSRHGSSGHYAFNYKEMENYEITRHKFDNYRGPTLNMDGAYTLSDKWRRLENKKSEMSGAERDDDHGYPETSRSLGELERKFRSRSLSTDRDFRSGADRRSHPTYETDVRKPLPPPPADTRPSLEVRHKDSPYYDGKYGMERGGSERDYLPPRTDSRQWYSGLSRHPADALLASGRERGAGDTREPLRGGFREPWPDERYERSRMKPEKLLGLPQRTDRVRGSPYMERPPESLRGPSYYEYGVRESSFSERESRGPPRGSRGRGQRGRFSRGGTPRGFKGRNSYQSATSPRGRGFGSRRRMSSGSYPLD